LCKTLQNGRLTASSKQGQKGKKKSSYKSEFPGTSVALFLKEDGRVRAFGNREIRTTVTNNNQNNWALH